MRLVLASSGAASRACFGGHRDHAVGPHLGHAAARRFALEVGDEPVEVDIVADVEADVHRARTSGRGAPSLRPGTPIVRGFTRRSRAGVTRIRPVPPASRPRRFAGGRGVPDRVVGIAGLGPRQPSRRRRGRKLSGSSGVYVDARRLGRCGGALFSVIADPCADIAIPASSAAPTIKRTAKRHNGCLREPLLLTARLAAERPEAGATRPESRRLKHP